MIEYCEGDLLAVRTTDALVNTVNCVGVMGKGIALQFKYAFPRNYLEYERACRRREVQVGKMFVTETGIEIPKYIINFPTKQHWRNPSQIDWIKTGLADLRTTITSRNIHSLAIPALGCQNGGLRWGDVRPLIEDALGTIDFVPIQVLVYLPRVLS